MKPYFAGTLCTCVVCLCSPVQAFATDARLPMLAETQPDYYAVPTLLDPVARQASALSLQQGPSAPARMADLGVPIDLGTLRTAESDGC